MRSSRALVYTCLAFVALGITLLSLYQRPEVEIVIGPTPTIELEHGPGRLSRQVFSIAADDKSHRCVKMVGMGDRCAPWFFIIGVFKGATTSVYNYLGRHPEVQLNIADSDDEGEEEEEEEEEQKGTGRADRADRRTKVGADRAGLDALRRLPAEINQMIAGRGDPAAGVKPVRTKETNFFTTFNRTGKVKANTATPEGPGPAQEPDQTANKPKRRGRPQSIAEYMDTYFPYITAADNAVTGEASPSYVYAPLVPDRLHAAFPHARTMLLLRDPITRSFSRVAHAAQLRCDRTTIASTKPAFCENDEVADLYDAVIERELKDVQKCLDKENIHPTSVKALDPRKWQPLVECFNAAATAAAKANDKDPKIKPSSAGKGLLKHMTHLKTVSHGLYLLQLIYWHRVFPKDQLLVLRSEDIFTKPADEMKKIEKYLQLAPFQWDDVVKHKYNVGMKKGKTNADFVKESGAPKITSSKIHAATLRRMQEFFHPWNELLGLYFGMPGSPWPYPGRSSTQEAPPFVVKYNVHAVLNITATGEEDDGHGHHH